MNRGLGPPIRVLHIGRWGGVAGSATVEENSTIPPSPRGVKGLERVAVVIAIKVSRIARSRPTAARMRGRSKAKRLERATREPHNRFRRPIEVDTDSGACYWLHPSRKSRLVGSAEAETAWRERPHLWPRARSQTRSDLVVAHATAALCVARKAALRLPRGRRRRPDSPLRNNWPGGRYCSETM